MSDIEVSFATNAAEAAAQIDGAEKSTAKAANTADRFSKAQEKLASGTTLATKALRATGLAAGLMGMEFGGAIGKVAGLATAGASVGGPWGAAIGAAIGLVSAGIKMLGDNSDEAKEKLKELKEQLEKLSASRVQLTAQAANEGNSLNAKHGREIRANIYETGSILGAEKSKREQALINMGMDPEAAKMKAEAEQRYRDNGGLLGGREQNGSIDPYSNPYQYGVIKNLNQIDAINEARERDQKLQLGQGEYNQAILDNEKNTKGTLELLKKVTTAEGRLKVEVKNAQKSAQPQQTSGWHMSWANSYWGGG